MNTSAVLKSPTPEDFSAVLKKIPAKHRGILFERIFRLPQRKARRLERAFVELWAKQNPEDYERLLVTLLFPKNFPAETRDPRARSLPRTAREWEVAYLVAATLIQWLPTTCGMAFLQEAFKNAGGKLECELPHVDD